MHIFKNDRPPIIVVTCFLFIYTALAFLNPGSSAVATMFILSPFMLIWLVYSVLKFGKPPRELKEGEEFGYSDKNNC